MKQILILGIIIVVATFVTILANPSLNKEIRIVNTQYEFQNKDINTVETKTANVQNKNVAQTTTVKMNNVEPQVVKQSVNVVNKVQPTVQQKNTVKNVTTSKNVPAKATNVKQTAVQKTTVKPVQTQTTTKPVAVTKPATQPAQPVKAVSQPQPKPTSVKTAEQVQKEKEAQEAISWNKWRANVHNQIIAQINLPNVPAGTMFTYSFTVTKDGTISNVKTSSVAPQYTAYAIQYIAPVVRRSAHASFLRFPSGTERTVVDVQYKFKVTNSGSGTQASANNFNDVEVIKK